MTNIDLSSINEAIELLIDIKNTVRKAIPSNNLEKKHLDKIKNQISILNRTLARINEQFGIQIHPNQKKSDLIKNLNNLFIVVNSSNNRKKLIDLGFDSDQILATGGPVTKAALETFGSNIPVSAIKNIQNKILKFWKILKIKLQKKEFKKIILLLEKNNIADKMLMNSKDEFEKNISIPFQSIIISSFDELNSELLSLLAQ